MTVDTSSPCGILTRISLVSEQGAAWAAWQSRFTQAAAEAPGFLSIEIIPLFGADPEWHVIQRFDSPSGLARWQDGETRQRLMKELLPLRAEGKAVVDERAADFHAVSAVTEVITTRVSAGREANFLAWAARMQALQATCTGYLGTLVQAPLSAELPFWTTLVRFSSPAELDAWLASPERLAQLAEADPAVSAWQSHRLSGPFAGWFPTRAGQATPPAWKQSALVLLVLFPVVMLEMRFLSPLLHGLPVAVGTFIGNAISVALVSWLLMRLAVFCLGWWLQPKDDTRKVTVEWLGAATLIGLYILEVLAFIFL
jgi:antibiotic biosynthesis monooxygenase (ABM) superfamily enzyme